MDGTLRVILIIGLIMVFAGGSCAPGCFFMGSGRRSAYRRRYRSRGWFSTGRRSGFSRSRSWGGK